MKDLLDWIASNMQWVFSGIGVAILATVGSIVVAFLAWLFNRKKGSANLVRTARNLQNIATDLSKANIQARSLAGRDIINNTNIYPATTPQSQVMIDELRYRVEHLEDRINGKQNTQGVTKSTQEDKALLEYINGLSDQLEESTRKAFLWEIGISKDELSRLTSWVISDVDGTDKRIAERIRNIRKDVENRPADELYHPPILPDRIAYIYRVRHDIAAKVRNIVLNWSGGWAGSSMADFNIYFDLARTHRLIPNDLAQEINDFYFLTQPFLNIGNVTQDEQYLEIQSLALDIDRQLDNILLQHNTH